MRQTNQLKTSDTTSLQPYSLPSLSLLLFNHSLSSHYSLQISIETQTIRHANVAMYLERRSHDYHMLLTSDQLLRKWKELISWNQWAFVGVERWQTKLTRVRLNQLDTIVEGLKRNCEWCFLLYSRASLRLLTMCVCVCVMRIWIMISVYDILWLVWRQGWRMYPSNRSPWHPKD